LVDQEIDDEILCSSGVNKKKGLYTDRLINCDEKQINLNPYKVALVEEEDCE